MRHDPKHVALVAAPLFTNLMANKAKVEQDDVIDIIRERARTALSQARILLDEAHEGENP